MRKRTVRAATRIPFEVSERELRVRPPSVQASWKIPCRVSSGRVSIREARSFGWRPPSAFPAASMFF